MTQLKKEVERPEIMKAIKDSINDARYVAQGLSQSFKGNVQSLRVEESEKRVYEPRAGHKRSQALYGIYQRAEERHQFL